jgi:MauM/NapG family ferredoxin protein
MPTPDDKPLDRRRFFRQGFAELLKPIAKAMAPMERVVDQLAKLDAEPDAKPTNVPPPTNVSAPTNVPPPTNSIFNRTGKPPIDSSGASGTAMPGGRAARNIFASPKSSAPPNIFKGPAAGAGLVKLLPRGMPIGLWVRPPGSIPERTFLQTCDRNGACVKACPVQCIEIDATGQKGAGAPYIDVDTTACAVCTGLHCMDVCPTGALQPTPLPDIDMGTAVFREETCLRSTGQNCTICVDHCPLGTAAIELKAGEVTVNPLGCIGCGVCQQDCPTAPKSIFVIPISAKRR